MTNPVAAGENQNVAFPAFAEPPVFRTNRHHVTPARCDPNSILPQGDYTLLGLIKRERYIVDQMLVEAVIDR